MIDQNIVDSKISEIISTYGAFFAFGNKQFNKRKKEDVKYTRTDYCLVMPVGTEAAVWDAITKVYKEHAITVLAKYGVEYVIIHELDNHEICVTGDITDTVNAVEIYGITESQVDEVYRGKDYQERMSSMGW